MFHSARLTLTLWYILIACIITAFFSLLAYNGFRFEFERGLQKQLIQFENNNSRIRPLLPRRIDTELQRELRERLLFRILYIDLAIIVTAAAGGYVLAGRTLKPIRTMVEEQRRFITDASHELRTPLTAMRSEMEANLLAKVMTDKEAKELIKSSLEEVIKLQNLSNGLLTLAQTQTSSLSQKLEPVVISHSIQEAIATTSFLAKKKHITIVSHVKSYKVHGSNDDLINLFVILLDNAIKYSPEKTQVTLNSKKIGHTVSISLKDQGIGIDQKDTEKIFERFYRTDMSRQRSDIGGYGLGLSIAKQIVSQHKGSISVASTVKKGSVFTIQLPAFTS